ncbi:MAG TPA: type I-E CRISPR-associated protein Cse2/CasB [Gammaproteobacteria bacterium]|nr:type I-E CRISPR-associated protein Cse2/CasB [Gammaproteobacteria bacterium]
MNTDYPDLTGFYAAWIGLNKRPGATADIRRVATPDELLDLPSFYRLVEPFGWTSDLKPWEKARWQRLVFCINDIENRGEPSLGKALALSGKVNEKRLFQIVRSGYPSDVIQLRRILKQAKPNVSWKKMARQLWRWDKCHKRSLMEDYILNQKD